MNRKDCIIRRLTNENVQLRESLEARDPELYRLLVANDRIYLKNLGHDIRMRSKLRGKP